jgi:hypothetical protein
LTLKDGGFGDADGIENGIIVDPLAFGSESDPSGGGSGGSPIDDIVDGIVPDDLSCFISTAGARSDDRQSWRLWHAIQGREPAMILVMILMAYLGHAVFARVRRNRKAEERSW